MLRFIRTANTVIFLGVGLLLLSILGYAAYQIYRDTIRERTVSGIVNTTPSQEIKIQASLESFSPIEGTPYYLAPISVAQNYRQDYYDKTASSIRNYLVLNLEDKSAVRLVPKNERLFLNVEKLGQQDKAGKLVKTQSLMYEVVTTDTNGDKRLTESDDRTIALSDVSGKSYKEVLPRVSRLLGKFQPNPSTLILLYAQDQKNLLTEIDVATRQIRVTQELPAIQ